MSAGQKKNLKFRYTLMAAAVAVVIAAWSGGWFYIRGLVDQRITSELSVLNGSGNRIACGKREISPSDESLPGFTGRFVVAI